MIYISTILISIAIWLMDQQEKHPSYSIAYLVVLIMLVVTTIVSIVEILRNSEVKFSKPLNVLLLILTLGLFIFKVKLYYF